MRNFREDEFIKRGFVRSYESENETMEVVEYNRHGTEILKAHAKSDKRPIWCYFGKNAEVKVSKYLKIIFKAIEKNENTNENL